MNVWEEEIVTSQKTNANCLDSCTLTHAPKTCHNVERDEDSTDGRDFHDDVGGSVTRDGNLD